MNRTIAAAFLAAIPLFGQAPSAPAAKTAAKPWTMPRTPDGHPDLQGVWINFERTPFERPLPGAQNAAAAARVSESAPPPAGARPRAPQGVLFTDQTPLVDRRDSMVVDPPSGRVPLTPWAEQIRDYSLAHVSDSWEYNTPWERCVTRGVPAGIFPASYNNAYQIFQTPGQVVMQYEMIHQTRVIPTDGRPHLPQNVRTWDGDSRGHWEGDTLVVETTNFNGKNVINSSAAGQRVRAVPESEEARIVERFTRVSADTINYEVTVVDEKAYTAPWKVAMPLTRDDSYKIFEYSCHEGNQDYMEIVLGGGRLKDKEAEGKK
jgi:hypothetical protein